MVWNLRADAQTKHDRQSATHILQRPFAFLLMVVAVALTTYLAARRRTGQGVGDAWAVLATVLWLLVSR